jgi:hypothetical protein
VFSGEKSQATKTIPVIGQEEARKLDRHGSEMVASYFFRTIEASSALARLFHP